ncbi:uncharacterized protein LOC126853588 [Cataglyphis hispanica]|uniref:uncharacterized protein LOC126853588 n=1 Tax=Cataglyphis hispanica TaxID=1086592 RepID=UPI0021805278|nr:uncharacterized protein LOC126853588 [Cataglyphis hispanica]
MSRKLTPENVIAFTKLSLVISLSWPLPAVATKRQVILFRVLRFLIYVNIWCLFVPLFMTLQDWNERPDICVKSIPLIAGSAQAFIEMWICHGQHKHLQLLIAEMENYCKHAIGFEKDILQQYVDRYAIFYAVTAMWFYLTAFAVICSPPFLSQPFPTFDMLCYELRMISNVYELTRCIRKHQQLLRYANDVTHSVRFLVLTIVGGSAAAVLFVGLTLVSQQPLIIKLQFCVITFTCLSQVFMCCWPANNLLNASSDVALAVYESLWYSRNVYMQKNLLPILLRCQKPVAVTVTCIIPILSLRYFGSYISTAFSYFTTLRVMLEENEADKV